IGDWDVSSVYVMEGMVNGATSFVQDLGGWDISDMRIMRGMLDNSGLSVDHYDDTVIGWAAHVDDPGGPLGMHLDAEGLTYCAGAEAHAALEGTHGWTINGDTEDCPPAAPTGLTAEPGDTEVLLTWAANSETDLDSY